jgi:hypothetical protein
MMDDAGDECGRPSEEDLAWWAAQNDDDIAEADPWTEGDDWEADGRWDDLAGESAYMDAHEQGLKTF